MDNQRENIYLYTICSIMSLMVKILVAWELNVLLVWVTVEDKNNKSTNHQTFRQLTDNCV